MEDNKILDIAQRLYAAINSTIFSGELNDANIELEDSNNDYIGQAGFDKANALARLEEIEAHGEACTPIKMKIVITRDNIKPDKFETIYRIADTLLHEAIHIEKDNFFDNHGQVFQASAKQHGLEVITDADGNYINTRITIEALAKILAAAGFAKPKQAEG